MSRLTRDEAVRLIDRDLSGSPEFADSDVSVSEWLSFHRPNGTFMAQLRDWDRHVEEGLDPLDFLFDTDDDECVCGIFVDAFWEHYNEIGGFWFEDPGTARVFVEQEARVHLAAWRERVFSALGAITG